MKTYYVYHLLDPRDGLVFYVGKGKGNRMYHHAQEAKRGVVHPKCDMIREIWDAGLEISYVVVQEFADEEEAYAFEIEEIKRIGRGALTNLTDGGDGGGVYFPKKQRPNGELTADAASWLAYVWRLSRAGKLTGIVVRPTYASFDWPRGMTEAHRISTTHFYQLVADAINDNAVKLALSVLREALLVRGVSYVNDKMQSHFNGQNMFPDPLPLECQLVEAAALQAHPELATARAAQNVASS